MTMTRNILFDNSSWQIAVHTGNDPDPRAKPFTNLRLSSFMAILSKIGTSNEFSTFRGAISPSGLKGKHLLVIATRMPRLNLRTASEIAAIQRYYHNNGSVLLMTNHPFNRSPKSPMPDKDVASLLGVELVQDYIKESSPIRIPPSQLSEHPITRDIHDDIVFNTSCRIDPKSHVPIARIPNAAEPNAFAVVSRDDSKHGRFVILADSGFVANDSTNYPGPGQFNEGANERFIENIILWLLHDL